MPRKSKGTRKNKSHREQTLPASFKPGFLAELDSRTSIAKALRSNYDAIVADLGSDVSYLQGTLIERAVWLETYIRQLESGIASGALPQSEVGKLIHAVNCLQGIAMKLGLGKHQGGLFDALTVKNSAAPAVQQAEPEEKPDDGPQ